MKKMKKMQKGVDKRDMVFELDFYVNQVNVCVGLLIMLIEFMILVYYDN